MDTLLIYITDIHCVWMRDVYKTFWHRNCENNSID